jgi:propionyl-CoA carboxylase alpha chain
MNTRIQVEHPVTELITGLDLVAAQLRIALGGHVPSVPKPRGHAIEARIYAEDPFDDYAPRTGPVLDLNLPELPGVRLDTHLRSGSEVGIRYDPMLAKLIAHGEDREEARRRLVHALGQLSLLGVGTNKAHLVAVLNHPDVIAGEVHTGWLEQQDLPRPAKPIQARFAALAFELSDLVPTDGFRNNRFRDAELSIDGEKLTWRRTRAGLESFGMPLSFTRDGPAVDVEHGEWFFRARVVETEAGWEVWTPSGQATLSRDAVFPDHSAAEDQGGLVAQMPGKVLRVLVAAGDEVEQGQPLLVLEAMKMEQTLRAPAAGTVEAILVSEGDQVDPGAVLARMG